MKMRLREANKVWGELGVCGVTEAKRCVSLKSKELSNDAKKP